MCKQYLSVFVAFALSLLVQMHARANEPQIVASIGGNALDVVVDDSIAYVANGEGGVLIVDVSDSSIPRMIGKFTTEDSAVAVTLQGETLYVAAGRNEGVLILDVSDPSQPVLLGRFRPDGIGNIRDIFFDEGTVYVTDSENHLIRVVDVQNPTAPQQIGLFDTTPFGRAIRLTKDGQTLYASLGLSGLISIDATDPTSLSHLDSYGGSRILIHGVVKDQYLIVAADSWGIEIIDISNPDSLVHVVTLGMPSYGDAVHLDLEGDIAYLASRSVMHLIDVSNPASPAIIKTFDTPGSAEGIDVVGTHAFVACENADLQVVDVSDPANLFISGSLTIPSGSIRVTVDGDFLYVADSSDGFLILDISDPFNPSPVGSIDLYRAERRVALKDDIAFVIADGLFMVDVHQPELPVLVNKLSVSGGDEIKIVGDYLYWAESTEGFIVFDISDLKSPVFAGWLQTFGADNHAVAIQGDYAYLAQALDGVQIAYIADPGAMLGLGRVLTDKKALDIEVDGQYAYVLVEDDGLLVIDVANVISPTIVSGLDVDGVTDQGNEILVDGSVAYITNRIGVRIVDISNPLSPQLVSSFNTPGDALGIALHGKFAFVADGGSGIQVVDLEGQSQCVADMNQDGVLNFFDVSAFLTGFIAMDPVADFTGDGAFNFFDVSAFLTAFSAGCP